MIMKQAFCAFHLVRMMNGLEPISWDKFFEKFDSENLALLYQEENSDGSKSQFNKFVSAE